MQRYLVIAVMILPVWQAGAQYFQFSQYNYTLQRINPALVAASDYATLGMVYRNQATSGSDLQSNIISAAYPLLSRKTGERSSGFGLSLMDDRAGGIFSTQEASLSYAINVFLNRYQSLALGFKTLYQQRKLDLDGLHTGSQYIPDRGFDESMANGENFQFLKTDYVTFSAGIYWQDTDKHGDRTAYWGISFFDFNHPEDSFLGYSSELNSTINGTAGFVVYQETLLSVTPEILFTRNAGNNVLNLGTVTRYNLSLFSEQENSSLDIMTRVVIGRSGILGLQWHRENFSIGFSYDFPVFRRNVANLNAFEVGLEWKSLVSRKPKKKAIVARKPAVPPSKDIKPKNISAVQPEKPLPQPALLKSRSGLDTTQHRAVPPLTLKATLQAKQDSAIAKAEAGQIRHQPLAIEKVTLHFNFEFNSSSLDESSMQYLDELATVLQENAHLKIRLTGHTDNIGSAKFNQRLSLFRADVIREYLIEKGINSERMTTAGKGLSEPLNGNQTEEERAKNRRVELLILYDY